MFQATSQWPLGSGEHRVVSPGIPELTKSNTAACQDVKQRSLRMTTKMALGSRTETPKLAEVWSDDRIDRSVQNPSD